MMKCRFGESTLVGAHQCMALGQPKRAAPANFKRKFAPISSPTIVLSLGSLHIRVNEIIILCFRVA